MVTIGGMRLYATISHGKLEMGPLGGPSRNVEISVAFEERERLVAYLAMKIRDGEWDGHVTNGSSMDFSDEDGWPQAEAHSYVKSCVLEACERVKASLA